MEKKREMKEITLKAKLMKLEPKIELAKKYDEYISNKVQEQEQEEIIEIQKPKPKPKKKIIYQEEDEEEEEVVYVKKTKPKPQQESLEKTLYKSSQETLFNRAIEERIKANLSGYYSAMMPREY